MLTVACVLWVGEFKNRDYRWEHVRRLRDQVGPYLDGPYEFVCLTNQPHYQQAGIRNTPLITSRPGWWAKIELFRPNLFEDRVLYLDLDVDIVGDLSDIAHYDMPFAAIQDWQHRYFNSSVMVWDPSDVTDRIFTRFKDKHMRFPGGDQAWISEVMRHNDMFNTFPNEWIRSYKRHVRGKLPGTIARTLEKAKVIVYNGEPKPWDIK